MDFEFFGAADRKGKHSDGDITSEYPGWFFPNQVNDMQQEHDSIERALKMGVVVPSEVPGKRAEMEALRTRMNLIRNSKPVPKGKDKDACAKVYKDMANKISDSMFSRSDMKKGLADAHEELRRDITPCIQVGSDHKPFLDKIGITPVKSKITRKQAMKLFKLTGRVLEEPTHSEYLRKDNNTGTFRIERSLEEMV